MKIRTGDREELVTLLVTGLGKESLILGLPWLRRNNLIIDWKKGTLEFQEERLARIQRIMQKEREVQGVLPTQTRIPRASIEEVPEEEEQQEPPKMTLAEEETPPKEIRITDDELLIAYVKGEPVVGIFEPQRTPLTEEYDEPKYCYSKKTATISRITTSKDSPRYSFGQNVWIRAKTSISQRLAHEQEGENDGQKKMLDELLPKEYLEYRRVFEKEASERLPDPRPWDHAINLKPDFVARDCKVYPLSPSEQKKLDEFLEENLSKGYI